MKNKSSNKKSQKYLGYEHPLLKSIQFIEEDHSRIIPTYQPFSPSHQNRTSSKLLRFSTLTPSINTEIQVCLQPFHHIVQQLPFMKSHLQCSTCFCSINPLTEIINYTALKCNLCEQLTQISSSNIGQYKKSYAYQLNGLNNFSKIQAEQTNDKLSKFPLSQARQVCMVIQASEYNFQFGVHTSIINCIQALQDHDMQVGFVFFNQKSVIFIDQNNLEIVNLPIIAADNDSLEGWQNLPLDSSNFFQHISDFKMQMKELIHSIMYESFYIKKTLLPQVMKLLTKFFSPTVQFKYFISTLNGIGSTIKQTKPNAISKIFNQNTNVLLSTITKKSLKAIPFAAAKTQEIYQSQIQVQENMQFFIIPHNTSYKECISLLKYTTHKIYSLNDKNSVAELLYYDLYENLSCPQYFSTTITIKSSAELSLNLGQDNSSCLYENIHIVSSNQSKNWNSYEIVVRQANHATMIPLFFKTKPSNTKTTPFMQISYRFTQKNTSKKIILNASLKQIIPQGRMGVEWIDDEVLFNYHLRKSISGWDGNKFSKLKELLSAEYNQLIKLFVQNYYSDSINFPKTFRHYFLFIYLWQNKINSDSLNTYQLYKLLRSNLELFGKQFYPRVYKLQQSLKNIKCNKAVFENYNIVFMENGEQLYMIFSETSVQQIKTVFGKFESIPILAKQHYQLPALSSNTAQRQALFAIRESHQSNFLPLKIIDKSSPQFDCEIAPYLYQKEDHLSFLRKAWKNV